MTELMASCLKKQLEKGQESEFEDKGYSTQLLDTLKFLIQNSFGRLVGWKLDFKDLKEWSYKWMGDEQSTTILEAKKRSVRKAQGRLGLMAHLVIPAVGGSLKQRGQEFKACWTA